MNSARITKRELNVIPTTVTTIYNPVLFTVIVFMYSLTSIISLHDKFSISSDFPDSNSRLHGCEAFRSGTADFVCVASTSSGITKKRY
jgi:hypothetical protein